MSEKKTINSTKKPISMGGISDIGYHG
jgi:hypothetical protein